MRTTLAIDDDILGELKGYSETYRISLSRAATILLERGLRTKMPTKMVGDLLIFDPPAGTRTITWEEVRDLDADTI